MRSKALLFDQVFYHPKWRDTDAFPSNERWKQEIDRWLQYGQRKEQLDRYKPRLNDSRDQRDSALAEILAAYFLEEVLGHEVLRWEEKTNDGRDVDFVARVSLEEIFCEVKSPGWEGELEQQELFGGRKDLPKYIHAEARPIAPWQSIRYAIVKAYPKFLDHKKNLVILCDDLFLSPLDAPLNFDIALLEERGTYDGAKGYFADERFLKVGGLLALNVSLPFAEGFEYRHQFVPNQYARLPFSLACIKRSDHASTNHRIYR